MKGHITLEVIRNNIIIDHTETDNIICTVGQAQLLNYLAQFPSNPVTSLVFGAVGSGTNTPTVNDTALQTELGRSQVGQGGTATNVFTWTTVIPNLTTGAWTVTEGGIFLDASSVAGSGLLLNHFLFSNSVSVAANSMASLSASFTI